MLPRSAGLRAKHSYEETKNQEKNTAGGEEKNCAAQKSSHFKGAGRENARAKSKD